MGKHLLLPLSVVLFIGVVIYSNNSDERNDRRGNGQHQALPRFPAVHSMPVDLSAEQTATPPPSIETVSLPSATASQDSLKAKIKNYKIGNGAEFREELTKDPHQTPTVTMAAALELGEIFDRVKNDNEASDAFQFFSSCVTKESVVSLQTSCLRYAKRLTQTYPTLRPQWSSLEGSASDEAKDILKYDKQ